MGTFWDFCAPFYDAIFTCFNGRAYREMLQTVRMMVPRGASVLDTAAGTGEISLAVAEKASRVLCTDISGRMLAVAMRKIARRGIRNIAVANRGIDALGEPDSSYDVVIAGLVLHLLDEPQKAAAELRRVAARRVILPMVFTKGARGISRLGIDIYRIFGFAPRRAFTAKEYKRFLAEMGFVNCRHYQIRGRLPMAVAVWDKQ